MFMVGAICALIIYEQLCQFILQSRVHYYFCIFNYITDSFMYVSSQHRNTLVIHGNIGMWMSFGQVKCTPLDFISKVLPSH